jgi:hypothetical protein
MQAGSDKYKSMDASGKYVRYTNEQVEALERVYHECPKPSSIRRHQLIKESPILANIEPKQIKVWFQNRRYKLPTSTFLQEVLHTRKSSVATL